MIIILNNGTRVKVNKDTVQAIFKNILGGEAKLWQIQFDGSNSNAVLSGFNLSQVSGVCAEEDVLGEPSDTLHQIGLFLDTLPVDDAHGRFWAEKFRRFVLDKKSIL